MPNNAIFKESHNVFHYEFDSTFIKNLEKFLNSNLKTAIGQVKMHLDYKIEDPNYTTNTSLINELTDYYNFFQKLSVKFSHFIESINGESGFNENESQEYSILINYTNNKHNLNFYEQINQLINNSFKIIRTIKENSIIDFNILLNSSRYLQEFIQKNYLSTVYQRQASTTAAMLIKNEQLFFKAMDFALPDFILEVKKSFNLFSILKLLYFKVVDSEKLSKPEENANRFLFLKNLYLKNAYYDSYMNVFKRTPLNNDFNTVIKYAKLIPIIGNESIINAEINKMTAVPLMQNSNKMICNIFVKFSKRKTITMSTSNKIEDDMNILSLIYFFIENFNDNVFEKFLF